MHGQGKFLRNYKNAQSKSDNMSCEICGRGNCTRSFHSLESQREFDSVADGIKNRMKESIIYRLNRLKAIINPENDSDYINLDEAIEIIEDY
jgi:hypothetical protein